MREGGEGEGEEGGQSIGERVTNGGGRGRWQEDKGESPTRQHT